MGVRSYKLSLSEPGILLFLGCHARLAHLARDFIPYGETLCTLVTLLETADAAVIVRTLSDPRCLELSGAHIRFVGAPATLAPRLRTLQERLISAEPDLGRLTLVRLHAAGLRLLDTTPDHDIVPHIRRLTGGLRAGRRLTPA